MANSSHDAIVEVFNITGAESFKDVWVNEVLAVMHSEYEIGASEVGASTQLETHHAMPPLVRCDTEIHVTAPAATPETQALSYGSCMHFVNGLVVGHPYDACRWRQRTRQGASPSQSSGSRKLASVEVSPKTSTPNADPPMRRYG